MEIIQKAINVNDIHKSYGQLTVLNGATFSVNQGEIFALLGSNGAGKTTMMKILSTIALSDSGTVHINSFDIRKNAEQVRQIISLTGQNTAVDEILTGRENMIMIGKLRHLDNVEQEADRLLKQFDLVDAATRSVATYSGGMRRRLDLAMSFLDNPPIVFLDEPTTGLDPQSRNAMWKMIKELSDSGTTIFLTTQYLEEAEQLANQIAILHEGKIIVQGSVSELKKLQPESKIELHFFNIENQKKAFKLLSEYKLISTDDVSLLVSIDGSAKQITAILNQLEQAKITVSEFSLQPPTLEDVFLSIVDKQVKGV